MSFKSMIAGAALAVVISSQGWTGDKPAIERAAAEKTALEQVPGGRVKEAELEHEHGKLVWSFDIEQKGSPDIVEVQVDANTGKVVAIEHETPDKEAKEASKEKKGY